MHMRRYLKNSGKKELMGDRDPKVSVLTTVNRGLEFLVECVQSIESQTFNNWEHVIVSDGASTEVLEYLEKLSDPRQKVVISKPVGRAKALNLGLMHCASDLVAILDADDISHPERLELQYSQIKNMPQATVLSSRCVHDIFDLEIKRLCINTFQLPPSAFLAYSPVCHSATIIRKQHIIEIGGYDESLTKLVDLTLWKKFLVNNYHLYYNSLPLVYHRVHPGQAFEKNKRISYLTSALIIRFQLLKDCGLPIYYAYKPLIVFIFGLLPVRFRLKIRTVLNY